MNNPRFFVYVLNRPDGRAFYVGKGQRDRDRHHEREARRGHQCDRCLIIRSIWQHGGNVGRTIIARTDDENDALMFERKLISAYGLATLTNKAVGGRGPQGFRHTGSTRNAISVALRGRPISAATKQRISNSLRGHAVSDETRHKLSAAHVGRPYPEAKRLKQIGTKQSQATKDKRAMANAKTYHFIGPSGGVVVVHNLNQFCRENDLSSTCMCQVANGKRRHHKGWTAATGEQP